MLDDFLELKKDVKTVIEILQKMDSSVKVGDYIDEVEAKKMLHRGTTWFWERRKEGSLAFSKLGSKVYYDRKDIIRMLDANKRDAYSL